ncbi:hypothetical protein [Streptomyces sp. Ru72]|uniref:TRADD-N-associated membrane domain-containing protein n=1 Tax=Streptomyces sp. Ru72 TaxID=2080747 RepID=UPI000CDD655B|nr:hypothetical protein [Streptomyces sp. Ru72]POX44976.1 hypothetical protein C3488_31100 [Streptomyces sp. Ru72]
MAQSEPRDRIPASFVLFFLGVTGIIGGLLVAEIWYPHLIPGIFAAVVVGVWITLQSRRSRSQDDLRQVESRERVRTAEQDLENALRRLQTTVISDHGVVITPAGASTPERRATEPQEDAQARLALSELWAVTHRRLDHYHGIALGQAKQSFRNAQVAMGLGFALLVGFVIVALNASTTAGSVVAGGLGAVSAALAGYVSRTFIKSQEAAAGHLRAYFDQPLEFSRYLAAERLMADAGLSEEKQAEILSMIVQSMIVGPASAGTTLDEPATGS